jgi:membrane protein implicated in regulation of membrane protease activity
MPALRAALLVIGILMTLVGIVWLGQGAGYIPATDTPRIMPLRPWTYAGVAVALAGLAIIAVSRRVGRRP